MSRNIFLDKNQFVPNPKRNAYDLSKRVNGTYRAGYIYPIDWEEVTFGDSIQYKDISLGLRTMPMVWPIQTPVVAKVYSFYVRLRTLQKNFMEERFNNKPANFPFIALNRDADFWKTGELGDHLGIPTTLASNDVYRVLNLGVPTDFFPSSPTGYPCYYLDPGDFTGECSALMKTPENIFTGSSSATHYLRARTIQGFIPENFLNSSVFRVPISLVDSFFEPSDIDGFRLLRFCKNGDVWQLIDFSDVLIPSFHESGEFYEVSTKSGNIFTRYGFDGVVTSSGYVSYLKSLENGNSFYRLSNPDVESVFVIADGQGDVHFLNNSNLVSIIGSDFCSYNSGQGVVDLSDPTIGNPFAGSSPVIPLSAYCPRAYEMIYRYYFQDLINEPFILDGEPQYNRFITNDGDGADFTDYKLKRRNWEADFLTSAKPSPQQGMAPLVGMSSDGTVTLVNTHGDEYSVRVTTDNDEVITGFDIATQKGESDHSVRLTLLELATTGFTINSLRNTNAFQQWLEANYRRGLKFRDQVLSNFGVKLELKELDCPEFLGGFTTFLNVDQIAQTSSSVENSPLGDLAGNGALFGRQSHTISRYCDEEGIVMTVMSIVPIPVYSQLLNRKWLKSTPVDFYNPAFGKIGQQPITFEEVCPVQAYNEGVDVHNVFGYQRPWYHLISSTDEVHGQMRNSMSGFLMQRIFGSTPELGADFLHVNEEQLNDVFVARAGVTDTYYGQISFKKYKKTCIPRYSLPSLS